jgi:ribosome-associated toxin RatA of RatAB toxin-antitoxin module
MWRLGLWLRLVVAGLLLWSGPALAGDGWNQVMQDSQTTVWQREVAGSRVKEIKAAGTIDAPPTAVYAVIRDFEHYADIMPYTTKETKVLETSADGKNVWYYTVVDAPIVSKRDHTLKVTIEKLAENGDGIYKLSWVSGNDHPKAPLARDGYVRLNSTKGSWDLKPFGEGKTHAEYYVNTDPGGSLPAFVVNKANTEAVPKLFEALRKFAKKAPYNAAK